MGNPNWLCVMEQVLHNLFSKVGDTKSFDIEWKFIQLCLPTADRLFRHKIIQNSVCARCNKKKETSTHIFIDCPEVSLLWKFIAVTINKLNNGIDSNKFKRFIIIGEIDYSKSIDLNVENTLRDLAFTTVWSTRNKLVFDHERLNLRATYKLKLKSKIKDAYYLAKEDFDLLYLFKQRWCRNSALASLSNDTLKFHF